MQGLPKNEIALPTLLVAISDQWDKKQRVDAKNSEDLRMPLGDFHKGGVWTSPK